MSDKVKNALEARRSRKKKEEESFKEKAKKSQEKVNSALKARESRIKNNLQSTFSDLESGINTEIEAFKKLSNPSWGGGNDALKTSLESTRQNRLNVDNLIRKVEAHRKYLGDEKANTLLKSLNDMKSGYSTHTNVSEIRSQYKSKDEYEKKIKEADKAQKDYEAMTTFDLEAGKKDISYYEGELNAVNTVESEIAKLKSENETLKLAKAKGSKDASDKLKANEDRITLLNASLEKAWEKYGSKDELEALVTKKKSYYNQAKHTQEGLKLHNDALNAEDFGNYNVANVDFAEDRTYKYINDIDGFKASEDAYWFENATHTTEQGIILPSYKPEYIEANYEHMTDEEKSIFNYYYSKFGKEKAYEYLGNLEQTLNTRSAVKIREQNDTDLERMLFGVAAGLDQFSSGMENLFNTKDDYITPSDTQIASGMIREDLEDSGFKILGSSVGQIGYDLINTTSNMLPSILTSTVVGWVNPAAGAVVGAGLMGASASGNAYAEMLNLGYDKGQARLYSGLVGVSEATLQYLLGGIGKLGGKLSSKAVVGIANNLDNAIARVAIKLGGNALGEFTEEYLQEVLTPFFKNITLGTDEDVKLFSTEALYSGILGALSAGILETGSTISADRQTTKLGKNVQKIDGGVERLKKLGTTFSADTVAHQIADKVTEETGAYKIGLLLQEAGGTLSEQNVSDITIELSKSMDEGSAKKLAKTYQAFLNEEMSLTDEQVEVLENCDPLANVLRKSIIGRNTSVYQRTREYNDLVQLATEMETATTSAPQTEVEETPQSNSFVPYSNEYVDNVVKEFEAIGIPTEQARILAEKKLSTPTEGKSTPAEGNPVESKFEVSTEGKTIKAETGEIVNIKNIESISEDGEANLTLDDGMVVKASDLSYGNDAEAIFIENIGAIKVGKNPINTKSANLLYMTAMGELKNNPNMTADEAMSLIRGLTESYVYGTYNLGRSKLTSRNEDGSARLFAGEISQAQRKLAYELGTQDAVSQTEADQKVIDDLKAKAEGKPSKKTLGKVIFEKGAEVDESALTETQKANLDGIKLLAEISSVEFHVFRSERKGNTFKYTMPDGTVVSANGWFVAGTNEIWIDLNAGNMGEGTMIRTAAHEISHYIKQWSPQKWRAMADLLVKSFAENGVDTESMLNKQVAKIKRRYKANKKAMPSQAELIDMAHEELVSDALSDMLTDGSIVNFIAEVKAKDRNLAQKILDAIKSLLKKWGLIIDDYKGRDLDTAEAQALSQLEDTFKKVQEMYREAFMDANETVALVNDIANIDADSKSVSPMMSERTWTESEYVTEREKTAKAISSTLGVDIDTAYKYIDDINSVARLIADDRVRLDYDPNIDEDATVLKKNSEYKYSVDMSTLCAKRLLTTGTFDAIQRKLPNTVFSSEDIVALREMMLKRGYEVACGICYVESTRREMGRITQDFINSYIESQKTGKPITRINSSGQVVDLKKTKDEKSTTADKSTDKFYADKNYTPTLADLNTTDIDLVKKEHPLVYEAYLNFMNARGQAKPKLLETRAEYKGEILKHFKTSSAVKARNNAGGLRLQSFSDFEVPHLIDMMQIIMDMSRVGLKSQAYTKVPAFAEVFGNTGVKINLSLIAKGSGLDANGNLIFDDVEGINHEEAFKLRDKFSKNVGTILVGKTDGHIIAAMADPHIDYIIPFHKSSWKESLYEALGLTGYADYTDFQNEKPIDKDRKIKNFDPSEYWDFTKSGDENAQIYLEKCREDGRIPKFPQFQGYPGYWKLLIDFKMYDNDGVGSPQEVVRPTFEMDAANKILDEYKGGHRNFPVAKDVVEDFVNEYVSNAKFSERDFSYDELVAKDDLQGVVIDKTQHPKITNGIIDNNFVVKTVRNKCESLTHKGGVVYYVNVPDIGTNVEIINDGITHGFARPNDRRNGKSTPNAITNARVMLEIPQILNNSIEVNRSKRGNNIDVPYTHVLIGTVALEDDNGVLEYYAVRSMVQERKNQNPILVETNVLGKLTSVNAKKIDSPTVQDDENIVALADGKAYAYKIADLLNDVKNIFDNTFSEDVYHHFGMARKEDDFSKNLLFSERDLAPTFYSQMGKVVEGVKQEKLGANSVVNMLRGKGVKAEEIRWSGIVPFLEGKKSVTKQELLDFINGSMLQIGEQMSNEEGYGIVQDGENYIVLSNDGIVLDTWEKTVNPDDPEMVGWISREEGDIASSVNELREYSSDWYGGEGTRWSQYRLDGGSNYRELVFTMPNSTYTNDAMKAHWGYDAEGILAHARIQDFESNGKKMLFIEELQSDWHNEGHKDGYQDDAKLKELQELEAKANETFYALENYSTELTGLAGEYEAVAKTQKGRELLRAKIRAEKALKQAQAEYDTKVPDVPFKDNYHEYVLKRLLRMAAENGYDSIGWTPADIQSKRWSAEYAEGYRIEYDQDMPKFLKKYGRQWGAKVDKTTLENDTEIWYMNITDLMKNSVLYEGQVMYSERDVGGLTEQELWHDAATASLEVERWEREIRWNEKKTDVEYLKMLEGKLLDAKNEYVKYGEFLIANHKKYSLGRLENFAHAMVYGGFSPPKNFTVEQFIKDLKAKVDEYKKELEVRAKEKRKFAAEEELEYFKNLPKEQKGLYAFLRLTSLQQSEDATETESTPITSTEERWLLDDADLPFSDRDTSTSNRTILANALEGTAQNDIEKNKLAEYKQKISLIESEEQRLSEIQKKLFTKGAVEPTERKDLQFEAKQIANRINTYDRQLLNLESTTALKNVLNREKSLAAKRQKQKDNEALKKYKEKVAKTQRELLEKNKESRKKAIEGREKTAMRHKIKKVVGDLNNLLLKPTKERHIPEEMKIAVAEALTVVNMDTVDADTRVAKYNELIEKATNPDVIASLVETRDRILNQGIKLAEKLIKLKDAYGMVRDSADDSMRSMYDDVIYNKIESVQKSVGKTPLRNMTLGQLESVYELYTMVLTTVRDSNRAFAENITMTRLALGSNTFAEIKEGNKVRDTIKHPFLEKSLWQNLKPMQAMKTIGSGTLQKLWNNILYGQEVFAVDYDEAVNFAKEMKEKYGYKKWNLDKLYSFESKSGKTMKINLEQMMSIYAYSKRRQADEHIEYGGIVLNEGIIKEKNKLGKTVEVKVNDSTAYRLDRMQVGKIISTLEKEFPGAKGFVDEMQKYLSETMGEKGNEVSMKMYGIKLFKEEHYFPLKSSKDFMEAANAKLKGDVKIKNKGMTKSTVEHARNPIVLENFLDVWGNHINEMALYHGLVLPLEDFSRTLNYSFKADEKMNTDAESVRTALHDAFGDNADNYLNELLKAINGGVLHDSSAQFADKMISKFKKAKVMASLSVIVQQPTAIIRAMSIIEPKYFVAQNFNHKATWEELKKYCPTAIIKETGSFDTNMGRTIVDMIKDERGFTDKVGDVLGKAPAYMDEVGWNMIWRALKKKVATEQKLSGEALLQECGKQMTIILNETQVYDSVMSRNELMRSKSAFTKMATAFMAEPSTVANMIYGAGLDFKRGKKGVATKTVAATITSVVINGLVSAMVYGLRDDDEEKTLFEKYLSSATSEVVDGLNPLTYIPYIKDAYSLFQGYKVERTDMALIKDVVDAIDNFYNVLDPEAYVDMSREEIAKHIYENSVPMLTSICDMFGLPVGNILRDAKAIIVNDNVPMSQASSKGIGYALKEGLLGTLPKIVSKIVGTESKQEKLYDAIVDGDTAYIERLKSGYKDDKAYETALRKALRENDSRIKEAAEARIGGDIAEYTRIVKAIKGEGFFSQDTIVASINAEINAINKGESSSDDSATEDKASSIYKMDDYYASIVGGDEATAYVVKEDIINIDVENGKDRDEAEDSFNSRFAGYIREQYEDGYISVDEAKEMLVDYGDKSEEDAASKVQYWKFKKEYPDYDDLSEEAVSKYYEKVEPHGIDIDVYYDYSKQRSKCKGVDANGDGKTDSGSVKAEVLQVINSLPITYAQKDALYYLNGWSAKTIYEAPWH
jgi:hypothetical protein